MNWDDFVKDELDYAKSIKMESIRQMALMVNAIVRRRKQLGWSQKEVGDRAGMTQAQVARLETQATVPRMETVLKVAIALGLSVSLNEEAAGIRYAI
ncbi:MAG TPA: helix-turn-helix transcriptional regulator [Bacilli bacterium]